MAFQFKRSESVAQGIHRMAGEQLRTALEGLSTAPVEGARDGVHESRKCIKRIRALLRLARPWPGESDRRAVDGRLRDAARLLGGLRDRNVLRETMGRLGMESQTDTAIDPIVKEQGTGTEKADCTSLLRGIDPKTGGGKGSKPLAAAVEGIYRKARKRFRTIERNRTDGALHDCRKRVKDLLYCLQAFRPADPARFDDWIKRLDKLAECLGDDHDMAVLKEHIASGSTEDQSAIAGRIEERRGELQRKALRIGKEMFRKRPEAFAGRVRKSWDQWRG